MALGLGDRDSGDRGAECCPFVLPPTRGSASGTSSN